MIKAFVAAMALVAGTVGVSATMAGQPAQKQTAAAGERVPTAVFAQFPFMANPAISPSGRYVAAKLRVSGRQHLAVLDLEVHVLDDLHAAKTFGEMVEQDAHQPFEPPP